MKALLEYNKQEEVSGESEVGFPLSKFFNNTPICILSYGINGSAERI